METLAEKAAGIQEFDCANHLAKNCGNDAFKIGHEWHTRCSCRKKTTQGGAEYKTGAREHRGCNTLSHPLVKAYQIGIGSALRNAV
eukprot:415598-Prymnesium_polylepis.1